MKNIQTYNEYVNEKLTYDDLGEFFFSGDNDITETHFQALLGATSESLPAIVSVLEKLYEHNPNANLKKEISKFKKIQKLFSESDLVSMMKKDIEYWGDQSFINALRPFKFSK